MALPPAVHLQRRLSTRFAQLVVQLLSERDRELLRRCQSSEGAGGTAWLTCLPTSHWTRLSDPQFRIAARLRLGLVPAPPPAGVVACNLRCNAADNPLADAPSHMVSCRRSMHSKGASTARHKELGDAISFHLQAAGMAVYPEVKHLDEDRRTRPDFVVISRDNEGKSVRILTDHTIVNPMASSRARTNVAACLATVARKKHRKYDEAARRFDASLVPMVFSTLGNIAPEALQVLRLERVSGCDHAISVYGGRKRLVNDLISAVSCAIQRGNAYIIEQHVQMMRERVHAAYSDRDRPPGPV